MRKEWRPYGIVTAIYGVLTVVFVRGFGGNLQLATIKESLQLVFDGKWASLATAGTLFTALLGSSGTSATQSGNIYQPLLMMTVALATIWLTREVMAGNKVKAREAFYKGTAPLVLFILTLGVIGLQLIPIAVGSWLYSTAIGQGIAISLPEKILWLTLFGLLALLSLYMIASSLFALLIVTLPNMTPINALRSARKLVLHRRSLVLRKILFLPLVLFICSALIMFPLLLWLTAVAEWAFFVLTMLGWLLTIMYLYMLYRELLNE